MIDFDQVANCQKRQDLVTWLLRGIGILVQRLRFGPFRFHSKFPSRVNASMSDFSLTIVRVLVQVFRSLRTMVDDKVFLLSVEGYFRRLERRHAQPQLDLPLRAPS